ncbi:glycoside hydrolase family 13 protein [Jatrophihabitans sp.]|uniref:glycoside hydrolase family 13 protein n=1 Tax=Jatrophihabitans sp. TaxID=1932789 RepID=UPI002BD13CCA|nr:alpha-glucosidase [Jatrophihabitans sp.]
MSSSRATWWQSAVVYQIYPRSFCDANGDGIGDLPGILARLDYLRHLGVDVLWLSPMFPSPQDDAGYDISNYTDVDPVFGSLADFDLLLAEVHRRGMKLVLDLVVNHTSDEHPWFEASRRGRHDPQRDWYWWRGPRAGMAAGAPGAEPTNWASAFSGSAWQFDEASGEYYLHLFSRKQPDLNWENPQVRSAVYRMMRWWLDRGVDGFRMDVINMISKDPRLPDGIVGSVGSSGFGDGSPFYICGPRIHEFLQEMYAQVFAGRDAQLLTVGEMPGVTVEQARLFTDPDRHEVDMVFQFEHVQIDHGIDKFHPTAFRLVDLKASFGRWQAGLAEVGWNSLYWNNHDQPRVVSRFGDDSDRYRVRSATLLGTVLHLHRGTPYVYQGEELGMTNGVFGTIADFRDIESLNYYAAALAGEGSGAPQPGDPLADETAGGTAVTAAGPGRQPDDSTVLAALRRMSRDNARTPMQWTAGPHAGFSSAEPWIGVNPNHRTVNAEAEYADPDSVYSHYRRLIALRHSHPVVARGSFTMLLPDHEQVYAFLRQLDAEQWLVLGNFSAADVAVPLPDAADWASAELLLGNYPTGEAIGSPPDAPAPARSAELWLRAWECRVYRRTAPPA